VLVAFSFQPQDLEKSTSNMPDIIPQSYPAGGVVPDKGNGAGVDKTGTGTYVSSENERAASPVMGNEVLERDAQTKGRWFAYVKTKQFWITLLLGQGKS
jgi:solute carrier family 35 protein F1/2